MKKLLLLLLLPALHASAQDLTGVWRGTFYSTKLESMFGSDNKYEVQIDNSGRACKGITYSYQNTAFYGKASLVGMWQPSSKNLIFQEDKLLEYKMEGDPGNDNVYMFTCYLEYRREGNREILEGDYTSMHYKTKKDGGSGKVYLEKVINSDFKKEDFVIKKEKAKEKEKEKEVKKDPPPIAVQPDTAKKVTDAPLKKQPQVIAKNIPKTKPPVIVTRKKPVTVTPPPKRDVVIVPPPKKEIIKEDIVKSEPVKKVEPIKPAELPKLFKERKNELVQTILTPGPEILIELYDNGEIDGDTISVFQNGKQIAYRKGLSTLPITLRIKIDEDNPDQEITMVAENLGSIPPNTALMIVKSGGNRYDLRISSSEQNNAVVRFRYKKE
ncbi:MAG: hypothetical protein ABIX01_03875 [Chitinophagaceae bacterium]